MVIFPNTSLNVASNIAERIRQTVAESIFYNELSVTISGGVKQYNGEDAYALIHASDVNLYEAKRLGKNRIVF